MSLQEASDWPSPRPSADDGWAAHRTAAFDDLEKQLAIAEHAQRDVVLRHLAAIETELTAALEPCTAFLTGAYLRGTVIAPLKAADIDVFVPLGMRYANYSASRLVDKVHRTLIDAYAKNRVRTAARPEIQANGHGVRMQFRDMQADVVAVFACDGGGYRIPNWMTNQYFSTDPARHIALWSEADAAHNGRLKPLMRLLKAWNREHGTFFRSFHLEALCREIFAASDISDVPSAVQIFFERVRRKIDEPLLDPAGYGDDLGAYLQSGQKRVIKLRLDAALLHVEDALTDAYDGDFAGAAEHWRHLFGPALDEKLPPS